jgi:acetyl esterase/lipase
MLAVLFLPIDNTNDACPLPHREGMASLQALWGVARGVHCAMLLEHRLRINNDLACRQEGVMTNVSSEENVVIYTVASRALTVDIFRPVDTQGLVPGLLFLPGGGWQTANRAPLKERYGIRMAQRGYVCVTGEYRVMDEAPWPAQIQDVKATIRWMRANSERLGIDPAAIVVGGKSAGGHLALLAAGTRGVNAFEGDGGNSTVSSEVAAVVGVAPVADLTEFARRPAMARLFGANPAVEVIKAASPLTYANKEYPPTPVRARYCR